MDMLRTIGVLHALTTPVAAQQVGYRFAPNDTLKYHEITEGRFELRTPQGATKLTTRHDARIGLVVDRGDTVKAWYEELTLSLTSPQGKRRPSTSAALHLPFRLVLTPGGHVTTLSAPAFTQEIASQTDLTRQFEDFFISIPLTALRPLATWADTVESSRAGNPHDTYQSRHVRRFRALRDTLLAGGLAGIVIAFEQEISISSSSLMQDTTVTIQIRLEGREEGTAVFAPTAARLLSRVRRGNLDGEQVQKWDGREMIVPVRYEYTSRLDGLR